VFWPSCEVAKLSIRPIIASDIPGAAALLAELGYPTTEADLGERLKAIATNPDDAVLVAAEDGNILGLVSVHSFEMIHRPGRLGRITSLVVAASARGRGLGNGEQRSSAHDFYASNGYKEERVRFIKSSNT